MVLWLWQASPGQALTRTWPPPAPRAHNVCMSSIAAPFRLPGRSFPPTRHSHPRFPPDCSLMNRLAWRKKLPAAVGGDDHVVGDLFGRHRPRKREFRHHRHSGTQTSTRDSFAREVETRPSWHVRFAKRAHLRCRYPSPLSSPPTHRFCASSRKISPAVLLCELLSTTPCLLLMDI